MFQEFNADPHKQQEATVVLLEASAFMARLAAAGGFAFGDQQTLEHHVGRLQAHGLVVIDDLQAVPKFDGRRGPVAFSASADVPTRPVVRPGVKVRLTRAVSGVPAGYEAVVGDDVRRPGYGTISLPHPDFPGTTFDVPVDALEVDGPPSAT